ncbi:enoyl-CoA hydratase/isomerase family protein [Phenylobacterium sp.]|uniref:enoyl-CoA hydratase/isomerase family protein n=1 Tax=Phenylobacterium sp. TaxID=1871053 RepID=UPI0035B28213
MNEDLISFQLDGGVARLTLNRPSAANAMNVALCQALCDAAIRCDEDPQVRAVHLTGAGRMFSAGGDLRAFAEDGDAVGASLKRMTTYLHSALSRLARMRAPLVVAVNGPAAGAGLSLAMLGDLVICAHSASFVMAYTAAGLTPDGGSTYLLPRLVGLRRAQELILTNRKLSAEEAVAWGLATQTVEDEALADVSLTAARRLADGPTNAFGAARALLMAGAAAGYESQMELEARAIAAASGSADGREGITAFLARRTPTFTGR